MFTRANIHFFSSTSQFFTVIKDLGTYIKLDKQSVVIKALVNGYIV